MSPNQLPMRHGFPPPAAEIRGTEQGTPHVAQGTRVRHWRSATWSNGPHKGCRVGATLHSGPKKLDHDFESNAW